MRSLIILEVEHDGIVDIGNLVLAVEDEISALQCNGDAIELLDSTVRPNVPECFRLEN